MVGTNGALPRVQKQVEADSCMYRLGKQYLFQGWDIRVTDCSPGGVQGIASIPGHGRLN
jgi:hypothetical protein